MDKYEEAYLHWDDIACDMVGQGRNMWYKDMHHECMVYPI